MAECRLEPIQDPFADFRGTPGAVTLKATGSVGTVLFLKAEYTGGPVAGVPGSQIAFTIVKGESVLDVEYTFSDPRGAGTLSEVCDTGTRLKTISNAHPLARYHISTEAAR